MNTSLTGFQPIANHPTPRVLLLVFRGGIDSAVTSTLAAKTGLPLLCVEMPIHQDAKQVTRANDHIAWLKNPLQQCDQRNPSLDVHF